MQNKNYAPLITAGFAIAVFYVLASFFDVPVNEWLMSTFYVAKDAVLVFVEVILDLFYDLIELGRNLLWRS
jgi:hypothetical protein